MSPGASRRPTVDRSLCVGSTSCMQIAPSVYELGDDGIAQVIDPSGDDVDAIQEAIDSCPAQALGWSDQ